MKLPGFPAASRKTIMMGAVYLGCNFSLGLVLMGVFSSLANLVGGPEISLTEVMARILTQMLALPY